MPERRADAVQHHPGGSLWLRSPSRRAVLLAALCIGIAVVAASQTYVVLRLRGAPAEFWRMLAVELVEWLLWAAFVPLLLELDRRLMRRRPGWPTVLGTHLAAALAWFAALNAVLTTLAPLANPGQSYGFWAFYAHRASLRLSSQLVVYGLFLAAGRLLRSALQQERLRAELAGVELRNLRLQLQPHFIFNTLNTAAALVRTGRSEAAVATLSGLGDLLRRALNTLHTELVPLEDEIDFLERYLDIQRVRFGDRLTFELVVEPETRTALVPALLLQPLVENAIRHGLDLEDRAGRIRLSAKRPTRGRLRLRIDDDGVGFDRGRVDEGVGLSSTRLRLERLYGPAHRLDIESGPAGTTVTIELPAGEEGEP